MEKGSLVRTLSGRFATVIRSCYTYRFMEEQDYVMESHGMGHLAGAYGTAVDVMFHDTGQKSRLRPSQVTIIK